MLACIVLKRRNYGINSNRHAPFLLIINSFTIYYKELNIFSLDTSDFSRIINLLLDYGVGVDSVNSYSRKNMNEEFNGLPVWDTFQDILKSKSDTKV